MPDGSTLTADNVRSFNNYPLADQIGAIKAQIAVLESRLDDLRAQLVANGGSDAGELFDASISAESVRTSLDRKRLERDLGETFVAKYLTFSTVRGRLIVTAKLVGT